MVHVTVDNGRSAPGSAHAQPRARMRRLLPISSDAQWGVILLPWLAAAFAILAMKFWLLHQIGFHETALFMGRAGSLSIFKRLALFRADLLALFAVVPAGILLVTSKLSRRWAVIVSGCLALLLTAATALEVRVWMATGSYTTLRMAYKLLAWELAARDRAFLSFNPQVWVAMAAGLVLIAVFTVATRMALTHFSGPAHRATVAILAGGCLLGAVAWIPRMPVHAWTRPLLGDVTYAFLLEDVADAWQQRSMQARTTAQLMDSYLASARVPAPQPSQYFGKARNANVLLFVMESMSASAFDPAREDLDDMPNMRRLRDHAFVMAHHYTSFPQTDHATFSLITSLYSRCFVRCNNNELIQDSGTPYPSMMRVLDGQGYQTGYFGFVWRMPSQRDDLLLKSLGFQTLGAPAIDPVQDREGATTFFGPIAYVEGHDLEALGMLRRNLHQWTAQHQKFAAVYFPEIGHDPYRTLPGEPAGGTPQQRGHALAVLQDAWLGQILDELQQDGALDNTIIVVTGDHGMRFSSTSGAGARVLTAQRKLDDRVMRVPMMIYVPQALAHTVTIADPTSHIDVMPTILDLLGISPDHLLMQGSVMSDPRIRDRELFVPEGEVGASGFYDRGSYYMLTGSGGVYKSPTMQFGDGNALLYNSSEAGFARRTELDHDRIQEELLNHILHPGS